MIESQIKKLKINSTNIKSSLFKYNKELIKLKKDRVKLNTLQQNKLKVSKKEKSIESSFKQSVANIGRGLISYPMSLIDKFKEFFGLILLGILVNNLPKIIEGLQTIFGKIKDFLDRNPFIVTALKFGFKVILDGIVGLAKVIKNLRPIIGGSFKFALDTLKSTKNQIGTLISMFSDLENTSVLLMQLVGLYDPPKPKPKPRPSSAAIKRAKSTPTGGPKTGSIGPSYNPNTGYTYNPNFKNAAQATGVLAPKGGVMGTMIPGQKNTWRKYGPGEDPNVYKQNVQRYNTLKPQGYAQGGTIGGFFSRLFGGGSRRALGNISPKEGTYRGSPSDIMRGKDASTPTRTPFASPGGTARGRKARQAINAFKMFEMNVDQESLNLQGREKSYDLFEEFTKQYKFLSELRAKYGDVTPGPGPTSPVTSAPDDMAIEVDKDEVIGKVGNTGTSGGAHIHIQDDATPGAPIPMNVKSNIYVDGKKMTSGVLTSPIGPRKAPVPGASTNHMGEDWDNNWNKKSITLRGGLKYIKFIPMGSDPRYDGYGNVVVIQAPDNKKYFLGHLSAGPTNEKELKKRQNEQLKSKIPGSSNEQKVWNYFRSQGLSEIAVAGIMGNASIESSFSPTIWSPGRKFKGLFQWKYDDRWVSLQKWAKDNKMDPESIDAQLRFAWAEMTDTGKSYYDSRAAQAYINLKGAKTPEEAAEFWRKDFERGPGNPGGRKSEAARLYKKWKGKGVQAPAKTLTPEQEMENKIVSIVEKKPNKELTISGYKLKVSQDRTGKKILTVTTVGGGNIFQPPKIIPITGNLLEDLIQKISPSQASIQGLQTSRSLSTNAIDPLEESEVAMTIVNRTLVVEKTQLLPLPV